MFSSPEPTPEQSALHGLKDRCFKRIKPYWNRIAPKEWKSFQIKLKYSQNAAQVVQIYDLYRGKLHHSNIVTLPELDQPLPKARPAQQQHNAAA